MIRAALAGSLCLAAAATCTTTPGAVRVPGHDAEDAPPPPRLTHDPHAPAEELPVERLELRGVKGGRIVFALPGPPAQVLEMLLDLDQANGRRPWAEHYEVLERTPDRVVSRWRFEGRLGIHPTLEMIHRVVRRRPPILVHFEPRAPAFGLAAFFGDHRIWPLGDRESLMAMRLFLDSGLSFANASYDDLERGLRSDARAMRAWMRERLASARR